MFVVFGRQASRQAGKQTIWHRIQPFPSSLLPGGGGSTQTAACKAADVGGNFIVLLR